MKRYIMVLLACLFMMFSFAGCDNDAKVVSQNLSTAADNFQIDRRIVFYNGITDNYILTIEGKCSVEFKPLKFEVTCKTGDHDYKKHYLGRADNVFPFIEQLDSADVSSYRYKVVFKPTTIIPDIEVR